MTVVSESNWHPFTVVLVEGCKADGRLCTQHCPEPCEDELSIELDCDANDCPEAPEGGFRCAADYVIHEGLINPEEYGLIPGPYRTRSRTTRDYWGEYDTEIDVEGVDR